MKTIVIYPGRFQPFGKHHYQTYEWVTERFGADNVYISTSNAVDDKSPLNFEEKSAVIRKYGIPKNKIIEAEKPYMPINLLSKFDKKVDRLIVVYGQKDYGRIGFKKRDGSPSYFKKYIGQHVLDPFKDSAYVVVAPHVSIFHNGNEICGTYLREVLSDCTRKEMLDLMGWFDDSIYSTFRRKFQSNKSLSFVKEAFDSLQESRISKTELHRLEQYADALFFRFGIGIDFKTMLRDSHFYQRLNDPRNKPEITADEIKQLFRKVSQKYGEALSKANSGAEGVLKDMSTDINIPFIIKWDKDKKELDLVPKTVMRKKNFYTSDPIYKVEQFKEVFEPDTTNQGKYNRHISHPYETDMTFTELKRFVFDVTKNVQSIADCTLKLDGWNFQMTYRDGRFACSRNKSTVVSPMSFEQLAIKYADKPKARAVFCEAFKVIEAALSGADKNALNRVFGNGTVFLNFEILHEEPLNVLKTGYKALSVHGMITYDQMGNELHRTSVLPEVVDVVLGRTYEGVAIIETPKVKLSALPSADLLIARLNLLQHKFKIPESANIISLPTEQLFEIKLFILDLGNAVIKHNFRIPDFAGNVNRVVSIIDYVGNSLTNDSDLSTFEDSFYLLDRLGGFSAINPIEGIVFQWGGRTFKLTGSFAALVPIFNIWKKYVFNNNFNT
jgi:hypothetical protein